MSDIKMRGGPEEKRVGVLNCVGKVTESLVIPLSHCVEFDANINLPGGRHEFVFELLQEVVERESFKLIPMYRDPGFPLETLKSGHDFDGLLIVRDIFVRDEIVTGGVKLARNFSGEFAKVKNGTFVAFLFDNSKVF